MQLQAHDLVKQFGSRRVVDEVSLQVGKGEVVGLLGPNGAGKTTCFYMIVGLLGADAGRITLDGQDLTASPMHMRARAGIGYLPQEASVFRQLSAIDNLRAVLELQPGLTRSDINHRAEELLHEFHIGHLRDTQGISLSGGERRRLEIARALASRPSFVLLDEPFAGVDPISVVDIQQVISHLRDAGIGVLITDHNVRETLGSCDRACIISEGRVLAEGDPDSILANEQVRQVYLGENFRI